MCSLFCSILPKYNYFTIDKPVKSHDCTNTSGKINKIIRPSNFWNPKPWDCEKLTEKTLRFGFQTVRFKTNR